MVNKKMAMLGLIALLFTAMLGLIALLLIISWFLIFKFLVPEISFSAEDLDWEILLDDESVYNGTGSK